MKMVLVVSNGEFPFHFLYRYTTRPIKNNPQTTSGDIVPRLVVVTVMSPIEDPLGPK